MGESGDFIGSYEIRPSSEAGCGGAVALELRRLLEDH